MAGLVLDGVGVRFGRDQWALRGVTLRWERGVVGLVGPNGAGKTTLLRVLATLLRPTEGVVFWDERPVARDPRPLRRALGYVPQDFGVYPQFTARELLCYLGELKGLSGRALRARTTEVLELVHLEPDADRKLGAFSGGMVRRLGLAQALLTEPRLVLLDEPTAGVDPAERLHLRNLLAAVSGERLVLLATHLLADVAATATELALLRHGRVAWAGSPEGLLDDAAEQVWSLTVPAAELEALRATQRVSSVVRQGTLVEARLLGERRPHPAAVPAVPTLEDAYLLAAASAAEQG